MHLSFGYACGFVEKQDPFTHSICSEPTVNSRSPLCTIMNGRRYGSNGTIRFVPGIGVTIA